MKILITIIAFILIVALTFVVSNQGTFEIAPLDLPYEKTTMTI